MSQNYGRGLAGSLTKLQLMCQPGLGSQLKAQLGKYLLLAFSRIIVGRTEFLEGNWSEGLTSQLPAGQRPPSSPGHLGLSDTATGCIQVCGDGIERVCWKDGNHSLVKLHHGRDIPLPLLSSKSKSQVLPMLKTRGLSKVDVQRQEAGSWGDL